MFYQKSSGRFKLQVFLKTIDVNVLEKALKNKDIHNFGNSFLIESILDVSKNIS